MSAEGTGAGRYYRMASYDTQLEAFQAAEDSVEDGFVLHSLTSYTVIESGIVTGLGGPQAQPRAMLRWMLVLVRAGLEGMLAAEYALALRAEEEAAAQRHARGVEPCGWSQHGEGEAS